MPMNLEQVRSHRDEIERLAKKYGAKNIRVFGSVARGEVTPKSDLDLLVDMESGGGGLLALAGFELALEKLLKQKVEVCCVDMDKVDPEDLFDWVEVPL